MGGKILLLSLKNSNKSNNNLKKENDHDKVELSEDEIPLEDLPPHKRKQPGLNLNMDDIKGMNPEKLKNLQFMNKKGQPLMIVIHFFLLF